MFNMLGRSAIIALRFEYFMGGVIHIQPHLELSEVRVRARTHAYQPTVTTTVALILHFGRVRLA